MTCQVLDVSSVWLKEFGSALSRKTPTSCWSPVMSATGAMEKWRREELVANPELTVRHFPLQRGYAKWPVSLFARTGRRISSMLLESSPQPERSPLICTTPYYAPVAERWPGPVVYYQTDLTVKYDGVDPDQVRALDRRMCRIAQAVCPNSRRVAAYMVEEADCDPKKITIVPNATRAANVYASCPAGPGDLPVDVRDLRRPVAGVIGNLAMNMDWVFLRELVALTPEFSWVFVGPTSMAIREPEQAAAREEVMNLGGEPDGRVRFPGAKPYGELQAYARSFDVAILPYRYKEPTYSGSSTRFYEHLAACRPMISTRGFEELLHKEPLLRLVNTAGQAAHGMAQLARSGFIDGHERDRWIASQKGTWEERASTVLRALSGVHEPNLEPLLR